MTRVTPPQDLGPAGLSPRPFLEFAGVVAPGRLAQRDPPVSAQGHALWAPSEDSFQGGLPVALITPS